MYQNNAFIALGSNIGNWKINFNQAFIQLKKLGVINKYSSVYMTEPFGYSNQKNFYNMAIQLKTNIRPINLLNEIKIIEKKLKKNKIFKNGPRLIDLDIIFYNNIILYKSYLQITHPRAHFRDFVLCPISEISPNLRHPIYKKTVKELIKNLNKKFIIKKIMTMSHMKENLLIF